MDGWTVRPTDAPSGRACERLADRVHIELQAGGRAGWLAGLLTAELCEFVHETVSEL